MRIDLVRVYEDQIPEKLAGFWFTLLGYVGAIVAMELSALKVPSIFCVSNLIYFIYLYVPLDSGKGEKERFGGLFLI